METAVQTVRNATGTGTVTWRQQPRFYGKLLSSDSSLSETRRAHLRVKENSQKEESEKISIQ
jgi:hypothetical protein